MGQLYITEHPLVQNKLSMLRNKDTSCKEFRELAGEIAMLLCYEATRNATLTDAEISTPLGVTTGKLITSKYALIPILRAGIGMTDGMLTLIPTAKVGHIGLYRDPETLLPIEYYCKLPSDISERESFLLDPMLATGGTSAAAIRFLKDRNVKNITLFCLIASPEGIERVFSEHPDVNIYTAAKDMGLNDRGYILPGLGDAGDRLYGTK